MAISGFEVAFRAVAVGVMATLAIDFWALVLKRGFGLPTTDWGMVGRWFAHLPRGVFVHKAIGTSSAVAHEHTIGWAVHYAIGVLYAFAYLYLVADVLSATPSLTSALAFALATLAAPWFILQPGLGLGVFANRAPRPWRVRLVTLSVHVVFGVALFPAWLATQHLAL